GQAREGLEKKNNEMAHNNLIRVQAIISELLACLDMEQGGEISKNLSRLYLFFLERLTQANLNKDLNPLDNIAPLLTDLRNTWAEAIKTENLDSKSPQKRKLNIAV
ncbi:flagellar export chaperone FliS, partial [bacterium]|nr:flagellar export chaperone FliS [bacterium]